MLESFSQWLVYQILGLEQGTHLAESLEFFFYDIIKILILLFFMIYLITFMRSYFSVERTRKLLSGRRQGVGNIMASLLGVVTPFCSCSSVPLFIGFVEAGIPLGVTFSFLITSPLVNEIAVALLWSIFGWKITALYVMSGIIIGVFAGIALGKMGLEKYVEEYVFKIKGINPGEEENVSLRRRSRIALKEAKGIVRKVGPFVVLGVAIGAAIHGYVPREFLEENLGKDNLLTVPIAVLIGIPLYSNAAGLIPIAEALINKGVPIGTALAFMMGTVALSFPEAVILRKVIKSRLILIFFGVTALGIILTGYVFNMIL